MLKKMDHIAYPRNLRRKTDAELRGIIADAQAAIDAYRDNPTNSYYFDEIHYAVGELYRREQR